MSGLSPPNSKNQEEQTPSIPSNSLLRNSELSKPPPSSSFSAGRVYIPALKLYGTLRYLGEIHIRPGVWAGIELDKEGAGRNDGSLDQHL
ncbi:hypothetical protein HMI55_005637 [Coelomomyces lativittatus]|nr:hypothetical protein HMI55_005637 [Coelomomyces lativittatus]